MSRDEYVEEIKGAVLDYINDNIDFSDFGDIYELEEVLNNACWVDDAVTGNASGSYAMSTYVAEENIAHNWDLLEEACDAFGGDLGSWIRRGAELCDVSIRCYLLGEAIADAIEEIRDDFDAAHEDEEDESEAM